MTKAHESFSAFLDGEATELDIQRLLKTMDENPEAIRQWHDLSKVQASLQGDVLVDSALEFSDTQLDEPLTPAPRFGRRLLQGGLAAAVALVVVTSVNITALQAPENDIAQAVVAPVSDSVQATNLAQQQFEAQQRLDSFLREHAEQASFTTGHAVVPAELEWIEADQ